MSLACESISDIAFIPDASFGNLVGKAAPPQDAVVLPGELCRFLSLGVAIGLGDEIGIAF